MTGPPTPPPSSAQEVRDAQRESSVPPLDATDASLATPVPDTTAPAPSDEPIAVEPTTPSVLTSLTSYQLLFPTIADLASKGEYKELVNIAERGDWNAEGDHHSSRLLIVVPLVLGYLILADTPPARAALSRLPPNLHSQELTRALFSLVASTSERKYEHIYARAERLLNVVDNFETPGYPLTEVVRTLISAFIDTFRRKTFILLSKAYSSLPLSIAQLYLGFTAEQVISVANEYRWSYNSATQILSPPSGVTSISVNGAQSPSGPSSLATFGSLASSLILDIN